jgi:ATP10 protein
MTWVGMTWKNWLIALLVGLGIATMVSLNRPVLSQVEDAVTFPEVTGSNLERRTFNLPQDFEGTLNLVALAFYQEHQTLVNTWLPTAQEMTEMFPEVRFYELPTLTLTNKLFQGFIDGGMRSGIRDKATREATITLYLDRRIFVQSLGLPNTDTIYLFLVDKQGVIHWRGQGAYDEVQAKGLEQTLAALKEQGVF